jgi:SAM-dependent methyltransferase
MNESARSLYRGSEELEILEHAVRYNRHIAGCFAKAASTPLHSSSRVLDFGAGIGTITSAFAQITGASPSTVELDAAQRECLRARGFETRADIREYPAESFELVFSSNVLEHIADDVAALSDVRSRLRPGARAAFWVPAFPMLWTGLDDRVGHVRRYTCASLQRSFEAAELRVERVQHQDSLGFFAALGVKWLRHDVPLTSRAVRAYDRLLFPLSQLVDHVAWPFVGKNLLIVATRSA